MPAFGTVTKVATNEMPCVQPVVEIDGKVVPYVTCTGVEDSVGLTPSKAILRFGSNTTDVAGPITLNRRSWPFQNGSRVRVLNGERAFFQGMLVKRKDQGALDTVVWEAWGDLFLLNYIPVRGCVVYDTADQTVKYIPRYITRFNPHGRWNCVGATVNGGLYPVFSPVADIGMTYQAPDAVFSDKLEAGKITAWTMRRALQHVQLLSALDVGDLPGIKSPEWRSLKSATRISFPADALNITAKDLAQDFNPLDRKLPDVTIQSRTMLGALHEILRATGTHGIAARYDNKKSVVYFYPKEIAQSENTSERLSIALQTSGTMDDPNSAYDFEGDEDATEVAEAVLVEGAPVYVETEFEYDGTANSSIVPEWTANEFTAFLTGIKGQASGGTRYATYPEKIGDTNTANFLLADGNSGRMLALAATPQAVNLLRKCFPRVGVCFSIDSEQAYTNGGLKGVGAVFTDTNNYPYLKTPRPITAEQAQFFTYETTRLIERLPIRIRVYADDSIGWHEVTQNPGLKVTPDGRIWFKGLAENIDGDVDALIQPALSSINASTNLSTFKIRSFKINARVPLDMRVQGYASRDDGERTMHVDVINELGGPPLMYVDSPDGYVEEHQVNSSPGPEMKYYAGDSTVTAPLNRFLPPGSEQKHAEFAAKRRLVTTAASKRRSCWKLIGIRPEYKAGCWIEKIKTNAGGDGDYKIDAPAESVLYDFVNQHTVVGGILAMLLRGGRKPPKKDVATAPRASASSTTVMPRAATKPSDPGFVEDEPQAW